MEATIEEVFPGRTRFSLIRAKEVMVVLGIGKTKFYQLFGKVLKGPDDHA
jgi:hypothetical protein